MGSDSAPPTPTDRVSATPTVLRWRDEDFGGEFLEAAGRPPTLPTHHHPTWQIGYVRAGALRFRVSNRERVVPAPNLALVAPHRPHGIADADDARVEYAQLELPEALYRQADPPSTGPDLLVSGDGSAIIAFDALLAASRDARPRHERRARLDDLLAALRRTFRAEPSARDVDPLVCRVRSYLDRITHRPVTIGELVDLGRVSRATLLRRFQRELGATPHDYHRSIRLHAACDRIDAGQSIAEASIATGFCDQPHLTRNARGVLAMGPGKWRQRRRVKA